MKTLNRGFINYDNRLMVRRVITAMKRTPYTNYKAFKAETLGISGYKGTKFGTKKDL